MQRGGIGAFVTLGNGLIQDRIEAMVGEGNLLACLVEWGGTNAGPGHLIRDSEAATCSASSTARRPTARDELAEALLPVGPRASPTTSAG